MARNAVLLVLLLVCAHFLAQAQISFSINGLYSRPKSSMIREGYRDGVGLHTDIMFSPLSPERFIQLEVGTDFKLATAGSESKKVEIGDLGDKELMKYKLSNRHLSLALKGRAAVGSERFKVYVDMSTGWRQYYTNEHLEPVGDSDQPTIKDKILQDNGVFVSWGLGVHKRLTKAIYLNVGVTFVDGSKINFADLNSIEEFGDEVKFGLKNAINSDIAFLDLGFYFYL